MSISIYMDLLLFLCLLTKHAIADLALQRYLSNTQKSNYYSYRAQYHYGQHAIGTFIVCLFFFGPITAVVAGLLDWVAHWHIDFIKHRINNRLKLSSTSNGYWWLNSIDQIAHFTTYFLIIILL